MSKTIVCYFSPTNTTAMRANKLAKDLDADILEIKPVQDYNEYDLNWQDRNSRSSLEMSNPKARVEFIKKLKDLNQYDKIVLGFPIWWYTAPRIVNSFLEAYDFSNKKVVVWATSGSSPMGRIVKELSKTYPNIKFTEGKVLNHISDDEYANFVRSIR